MMADEYILEIYQLDGVAAAYTDVFTYKIDVQWDGAAIETARVVVTNRESIRAFWRACELVGGAAEDYPWSDDLREAMQCLVQAGKGLHFQTKKNKL